MKRTAYSLAGRKLTIASRSSAGAKQVRKARLKVESLEDRMTPVTIGFDGSGTALIEGNPEPATVARVPVYLDGPAPAGGVSVSYSIEELFPQSAAAGSDFTAGAGLLNFPQGSTVQFIAVDAIGDTVVEFTEQYHIRLSNP